MLKKKLGIHAIERDWDVISRPYNYYKIPSTLIIPEGVERIGKNAFYKYEELEKVEIPGSVNTIRGNAFRGCRKLGKVVIPGNVEKIGEFAFWECKNAEIKLMKLKKKSRRIGPCAFKGCKKLIRE